MNDPEDAIRQLIGENMAYQMVLTILLADLLQAQRPEDRPLLVEAFKRRAANTSHFAGIAQSEAKAEFVADVTVRAQTALGELLDEAMKRVSAAP